jgi:AcrR family transcriptional regulator
MARSLNTDPKKTEAAEVRPRPARGDKAKQTRERIRRAAEVVFIRDGYLDARIADIAQEAGVAHGSFYTYFDSKEDVFRDVATEVVKEMYRSLDQAASEEHAPGLIRAGNELFIDLYERHASMLALIEQVATFSEEFREMRLGLRHRLVRRAEHSIARLATAGETQIGTLDRGVLANALAGMVENFAYAWFILGEPFDRESALDTLDEIWLRALGVTNTTSAPAAGKRRAASGSAVATSKRRAKATPKAGA